MRTAYPIIIFKKELDEKYHLVYIPDLDSTTQGEDLFECMEMARDLIGITWIDYTEDDKEFPKAFSSKRKYPFDEKMDIELESIVEIDFNEYKNRLENKRVKKTLSIPYNLNRLAEQSGINFSKVLTEALEKELSELNSESATLRTQWETEKKKITDSKQTKQDIEELKHRIEEAERAYDLETLAKLKYGELPALEKKLEEEKQALADKSEDRLLKEEVDVEEIAEVVSQWTGIPVSKLVESEREKLLKLPEILHKRVIGQDEAVVAVSDAILRARAGLKDENRPIGSFIFMGPTGVGKTELAKALSEALFDTEKNMIRIDMSEYMEKHSVSRLVGAPPGYVGYDEGGQLTEAVRRRPYSVILFDEIEKAHPDVFNILLQLLDDGRLTDNQGRTVDFKNTIIILTSNIGSRELIDRIEEGGQISEEVKEDVISKLHSFFRPEFINRIDDTIVFTPLNKDQIGRIIEIALGSIQKRLSERNIKLVLSEAGKDYICDNAYSPEFGARPVKRFMQKYVETKLAEALIKGEISDGNTVEITSKGEGIELEIK